MSSLGRNRRQTSNGYIIRLSHRFHLGNNKKLPDCDAHSDLQIIVENETF